MKVSPQMILKKKWLLRLGLIFISIGFGTLHSDAQIRRPNILQQTEGIPRGQQTEKGNRTSDTLGFEKRDDLADSITISFRYLDSLTSNKLDSSINDFGKVYSVPTGYVTIGNNGNAAYPILFSPLLKAGWDAGFHAFDVYKYSIENTRFYQTTRPYTLLNYFLASEKEQVVGVLHTQNIKPNWNAGINYRLISTPGTFKVQNSNHNNYRFFSNYQGRKKRYAAYLVVLGNQIASSENGGIRDQNSLENPDLKRRIAVPVNLSDSSMMGNQVYANRIVTGNKQKDFTTFFRQSYDIGKRDSIIINDSTKEYLFYPKLRFQHTFSYQTFMNKFTDPMKERGVIRQDSIFYKNNYDLTLNASRPVNFQLEDEWEIISNDFSIRQFPQTKNLGQFLEAGARLENYTAKFSSFSNSPNILQVFPPPARFTSFVNVVLHGEYRNKTRNKKWDALLKGEFYAAGEHLADFNAQAMVTRFLNQQFGNIQVSFQNVNRTPSYIFNGKSAFDMDSNSLSKKENLTVLTFQANNPRFTLMARNISIANYAYFTDFYQSEQFGGLINLTQITASTKNKISGHFNLYSDFILQQTAGQVPLNVPLFYTRQRFAFEGNFFKNLNLSTGVDVSYNTPYKANNYSPVMGAFVPQDSITISNFPKVNLFFNFRIKTFTAYLTGENINTVSFKNGFGFMNNNFAAPYYPTPGFLFKFGVSWTFVN
ncbi:MAG: putative porin [Ginsengibacter sp.]